ncbi:MAG: hypothetical protein ABIY90_01330 [Puia sp.]
MERKRRDFLEITGLAGLGIIGGRMPKGFASTMKIQNRVDMNMQDAHRVPGMDNNLLDMGSQSVIGLYGDWAVGLRGNELPVFSFRRNKWKSLETWHKAAKNYLMQRLSVPEIGGTPKVNIIRQYAYDGLQIEELSWQLPYGRPTEAILLKPL